MTCMRAHRISNFGLIGPRTGELAALERLKNPHRLIFGKNDIAFFFSAILDQILFILAGNDDVYKSFDEFEIRPDLIMDHRVSCSLASKKLMLPLFSFHSCGYNWKKVR